MGERYTPSPGDLQEAVNRALRDLEFLDPHDREVTQANIQIANARLHPSKTKRLPVRSMPPEAVNEIIQADLADLPPADEEDDSCNVPAANPTEPPLVQKKITGVTLGGKSIELSVARRQKAPGQSPKTNDQAA